MSIEYLEKIYNKILVNRRTIEYILKIAIAVSLTIFLVNYISLQELAAAFSTADLSLVLYAAALSLVNLGLQALKWNLVLSNSIGKISYPRAVVSFLSGITSGLSTPARLGEFIGRALHVKEHKFVDITILSFVDKLINILVITFFGAVSAVFFYRVVSAPHFYIDIPLLFVIIALFAIVTYLFFTKGFLFLILKKKFEGHERIIAKISLVEKFLAIPAQKKFLIVIINILFYFTILFQFYLLADAFTETVVFSEIIMVASLILLATTVILPFSFADIGVREGTATYLISLLGISSAVGFNAALVLFIINVIIPSLFGFLFLVKKK